MKACRYIARRRGDFLGYLSIVPQVAIPVNFSTTSQPQCTDTVYGESYTDEPLDLRIPSKRQRDDEMRTRENQSLRLATPDFPQHATFVGTDSHTAVACEDATVGLHVAGTSWGTKIANQVCLQMVASNNLKDIDGPSKPFNSKETSDTSNIVVAPAEEPLSVMSTATVPKKRSKVAKTSVQDSHTAGQPMRMMSISGIPLKKRRIVNASLPDTHTAVQPLSMILPAILPAERTRMVNASVSDTQSTPPPVTTMSISGVPATNSEMGNASAENPSIASAGRTVSESLTQPVVADEVLLSAPTQEVSRASTSPSQPLLSETLSTLAAENQKNSLENGLEALKKVIVELQTNDASEHTREMFWMKIFSMEESWLSSILSMASAVLAFNPTRLHGCTGLKRLRAWLTFLERKDARADISLYDRVCGKQWKMRAGKDLYETLRFLKKILQSPEEAQWFYSICADPTLLETTIKPWKTGSSAKEAAYNDIRKSIILQILYWCAILRKECVDLGGGDTTETSEILSFNNLRIVRERVTKYLNEACITKKRSHPAHEESSSRETLSGAKTPVEDRCNIVPLVRESKEEDDPNIDGPQCPEYKRISETIDEMIALCSGAAGSRGRETEQGFYDGVRNPPRESHWRECLGVLNQLGKHFCNVKCHKKTSGLDTEIAKGFRMWCMWLATHKSMPISGRQQNNPSSTTPRYDMFQGFCNLRALFAPAAQRKWLCNLLHTRSNDLRRLMSFALAEYRDAREEDFQAILSILRSSRAWEPLSVCLLIRTIMLEPRCAKYHFTQPTTAPNEDLICGRIDNLLDHISEREILATYDLTLTNQDLDLSHSSTTVQGEHRTESSCSVATALPEEVLRQYELLTKLTDSFSRCLIAVRDSVGGASMPSDNLQAVTRALQDFRMDPENEDWIKSMIKVYSLLSRLNTKFGLGMNSHFATISLIMRHLHNWSYLFSKCTSKNVPNVLFSSSIGSKQVYSAVKDWLQVHQSLRCFCNARDGAKRLLRLLQQSEKFQTVLEETCLFSAGPSKFKQLREWQEACRLAKPLIACALLHTFMHSTFGDSVDAIHASDAFTETQMDSLMTQIENFLNCKIVQSDKIMHTVPDRGILGSKYPRVPKRKRTKLSAAPQASLSETSYDHLSEEVASCSVNKILQDLPDNICVAFNKWAPIKAERVLWHSPSYRRYWQQKFDSYIDDFKKLQGAHSLSELFESEEMVHSFNRFKAWTRAANKEFCVSKGCLKSGSQRRYKFRDFLEAAILYRSLRADAACSSVLDSCAIVLDEILSQCDCRCKKAGDISIKTLFQSQERRELLLSSIIITLITGILKPQTNEYFDYSALTPTQNLIICKFTSDFLNYIRESLTTQEDTSKWNASKEYEEGKAKIAAMKETVKERLMLWNFGGNLLCRLHISKEEQPIEGQTFDIKPSVEVIIQHFRHRLRDIESNDQLLCDTFKYLKEFSYIQRHKDGSVSVPGDATVLSDMVEYWQTLKKCSKIKKVLMQVLGYPFSFNQFIPRVLKNQQGETQDLLLDVIEENTDCRACVVCALSYALAKSEMHFSLPGEHQWTSEELQTVREKLERVLGFSVPSASESSQEERASCSDDNK